MPPSLATVRNLGRPTDSRALISILPDSIACPACGATIPLSEALVHHVQEYYDQRLTEAIAGYQSERQSAEARARASAIADAVAEAERAHTVELATAHEALTASRSEIAILQEQEIALRSRTRDLEARERSLAVSIEREVDGRIKAAEVSVRAELEEEHRFYDAERDARLKELERQLEAMQRTARQGPSHLQGEVAESDLEGRLRQAFPDDHFVPVTRGIRGADLRQEVIDARGHACGVILWEAKNTKTFAEGWLPKLRKDQRAVRADLAILVSTALPDPIRHFGCQGSVWVSSWPTAVPLAQALRGSLLEIARAQVAAVGRTEKQTTLFAYVTSVDFRQRVESILEPVIALAEELTRERRAIEAGWAKRERQLQAMMAGLAALYGDVAGIAGGAVPRIARLELSAGK
jgi:hypothetical protein